MNLSLLFLVLLCLIFAWRGYRHGWIKSLGLVTSFVLAYYLSFVLAAPVGAWLAASAGLNPAAAYLIAALLLFCGAYFLLLQLVSLLRKMLEGDKVSRPSALLGAVIGLGVGAFLAFVLIWLSLFVSEITGMRDSNKPLTALESQVRHWAGEWVSRSAEPSAAGELSVAMARAPVETTRRLVNTFHSPALKNLFQAPENVALLNSGDVQALRQSEAFQAVAQDENIRQLALLSKLSERDDEHLDTVLAARISLLWQRGQALKDDPEIAAILEDEDFRAAVEAQNTLRILQHPGSQRLLEAFRQLATEPLPPVAEPGAPALEQVPGEAEVPAP